MSTSSADPENLRSFVQDTTNGRWSVDAARSSTARLSDRVVSASPYGGVSSSALASLASLLSNMGANEQFVRTVRDELIAADVAGAGVVTIDDARIAASLARGRYGAAPPVVTIAASQLVGLPQTSGFVDDPVCAANGNFIHPEHDLSFPGTSASLNLHRFYNSVAATTVGAFGSGWSSVLDVRLSGVDTDTVSARLADGATIRFELGSGDGDNAVSEWSTTDRRDHRLIRSDRGWELRTGPVGERRWSFDADGVSTGWSVDTSEVAVERDSDGRIVRMIGRRSGRSVEVRWSGSLVASVETDDGRRVDYRHDGDVLTSATSRSGRIDYISDDHALLLEARDLDGVSQFVNVYDAIGRVVEQTSPFGRVTTYRYDATGATVITDERGVRQAMVHDERGNLTAVVDVDGSAMRLVYDHADRVVEVVSKSGATWAYEFDDSTGDLIRRVDPDGSSMSWTWDDAGRKLTETARTGAVTRFEYDGDHRSPSRVIGPDGSSAAASFDDAGRIIEVTDPDGVVTRFEWDRDGQLVATTDAVGATTSFEYDEGGLLTHLTDPAGAATVLHYDATGRIERAERGDAVSTYVHTPAGRITAGSEPGDVAWSATFGTHGAPETIADALGATVRWQYDTTGNVVAVTAPDGAVYSQEFDEVGRLVAMTDPDGATTRKRYDVEGRLVGFVDAEGGVMRRMLDVVGRTVASIAPDGAETTWTYHPNGEIASVTSPDGRTWYTEIDVFGRLVAVVDPAGGRAVNTYSPAGRILSRTSPAGRTERFEYDRAGRCVAIVGVDGIRRALTLDDRGLVTDIVVDDGSDDLHAGADLTVTWDEQRRLTGYVTATGASRIERDAAGRVTRSVDATGVSTSYEWDRRGLLVAATDPAGGTTGYRYDERGRLIGQTAPGDRTTTWSHDPSGRVAGFVDPAGVATDLIRNANGYVIGQRRGDTGWDRRLDPVGREMQRTDLDGGVLGSYSYDPAGRLTAATTPDHDGLIGSGTFTGFLWDENGHVSQVTDATGTSTIERDADGWVTAFTSQDGTRTVIERDAVGRIVAVRNDTTGDLELPPDTTGDADRTAGRDAAGRLLIDAVGTVYRYDDAGRLAEIAPSDGVPTTFTYGSDGLVAAENGPSGERSFTYDLAGRVESIAIAGIGTTSITYDDAGRRATETHPDGSRTSYGWNALDRLTAIERTASDGATQRITIDVDALGRPQRINGRPVGYDPIEGAPNLLGDVGIVTVGAVSWRSDDGAWGRNSPDTPEGVHIAGLTLLGARTYDPVSRQFLSPDPLATVPGSNGAASAYTYAWHDPVNFVDPTGMRPVSLEEYDAIRKREEQGRLGQAWEAIKEDPWGTLAAVGVVALGVGLMFVPGGQVIGAGILIGAGMSAASGLATGNFSPRGVAVGGLIGGVAGGAGVAFSSAGASVAAGGAIGFGGDVAMQAASGQPIDWQRALISGGVGMATAGIGASTSVYTNTALRSATVGAATDAGADLATQALTGDGHIDLASVAFSGLSGGGTSAVTHHLTNTSTTTTDITPATTPQLAIEAPPTRLAIEAPRGANPWPLGNNGIGMAAPDGMRIEMAMSPGQIRPGGFGTTDHIPDVDFVRNDLAVRPDWKPNVSHVQTYEVPAGTRVQVGPVGPQTHQGVTYPGGANQVAILNDADRAQLRPIGAPRPIK